MDVGDAEIRAEGRKAQSIISRVSAAAWQPDTSVSPEDIGVERLKLGSPLVAEAVEKVRTIKFCATIVRASRACCNIDSTKPQILKHCFKNFERPDFFNTLSH